MNRQQQIEALKSIEKPFGIWPKELQECEFVRQNKDKPIWEWWLLGIGRWKPNTTLTPCINDSCDGLCYRLSPDYKEPEVYPELSPGFYILEKIDGSWMYGKYINSNDGRYWFRRADSNGLFCIRYKEWTISKVVLEGGVK